MNAALRLEPAALPDRAVAVHCGNVHTIAVTASGYSMVGRIGAHFRNAIGTEGRMRGAWGASAYFQNTNSRKNSKICCSKVLVPMAVGFSIDLPKIAYSLDISIKYSV